MRDENHRDLEKLNCGYNGDRKPVEIVQLHHIRSFLLENSNCLDERPRIPQLDDPPKYFEHDVPLLLQRIVKIQIYRKEFVIAKPG